VNSYFRSLGSHSKLWATRIVASVVLLFCLGDVAAKEITAKVVNENGEALSNVSVITNVEGVGTQTGADATFTLDVTENATRITFSHVGYHHRQFNIEELPEVVVLDRKYYEWDRILVTSDRARPGISPIAFDNYSEDDIKRDFTVGDPPMLLNITPNFYSFSDNGTNLGYTYTQIRGFDDKRIASYINGVPLNDPEDQYNYWTDLPDFVSNVSDIQVQRGVGNSLYGDASFGGSINVVTNTLGQPQRTSVTAGFGQLYHDGESIGETYKQSIDYSSGLINGRWAFGGRFSKTKTDGYRENSWVDSWSYYLSLARLDPNMTTELYVFGGPMNLHLTFLGADRLTLAQNRRFNPLTYEHETDNFNQPHYHLHNTLKLNDRMTLFNTLYFIRGEGFYEQQRLDTVYEDFNIDTSQTGGNQRGNLVTQQEVAKYQIGWNPRLEIKHDRGTHSLGGSVYYFESDHWGEVVWAQNITGTLDSRHKYYQYYGEKIVGSIYGEEYYRLNERLSLKTTVQFRYQRYNFNQDRIGLYKGFNYELDWLFFSPRVGFNYQLLNETERQVNLYTNFAISSRTATDAAIYDASNRYIFPSIEIESISLSSSGDSIYHFGEPTFEAERVYDIELGGNYRTLKYSFGLNLYWMNFSNEIIAYGGINPSNGQAATVNADGSYRRGIELQGEYRLAPPLKFSGNLSLNRYRIKDFVGTLPVYDSTFAYIGDTTVSFENVNGLGFPAFLGNFIADFNRSNWRLTYRLRFAGKQYLELLNKDDLVIHAFAVPSVSTSYTFNNFLKSGDLTFTATMDNLFDKKYEVSGYGWNYGSATATSISLTGGAEYYVAAERSWLGQIKLTLF